MTVRLAQSVFVVPALCLVARDRGFYDAEGVDVRDVFTASSTAQRADLDAGRVDVAITSTDNLATWATAGSDVVQVAQVESTTDLALMLRPGLGSIAEGGRLRLAVDAATNGFAIVAYAMLQNLGLGAGDYEIIEVGGVRERHDALRAGTADLTIVAPPLDEAGVREGMRALMRTPDLAPDYPGLGVVARRSLLDDRTDAVSRYLASLEKARRWIAETAREDVAGLLSAAGHGPLATESVIRNNPTSLRATVRGLHVLTELRARVSMPVADAPPEARLLLDAHPVLSPLGAAPGLGATDRA